MIAARQELDLRPQLERLDRLILWSEGIDEGALSFAFRPLWQMDEPAKAALALSRAQTTAVYAGLKLWPAAVMARLAEAQLVADGTYPNAAAVFAAGAVVAGQTMADAFSVRPGFDPAQPRDPDGRWTGEGGSSPASPVIPINQINEDPDLTPEEEEEGLRHQNDPLKRFRFGPGPDGIVRVPMLPGGGGAPSIKAPPGGGSSEAPKSVVEPEPNVGTTQVNGPASSKPDVPIAPGNPSATIPPSKPTVPDPPTVRLSASGAAGVEPSAPAAPTTLEAIEVPVGLTLKAQGETIKQQTEFYADEVRKTLDFSPVPTRPKYEKGDKVPDGLMLNSETGLDIALEVKYLSGSERGLRDPERTVNFINKDDIDQARKYLDEFKGGLLWVVNDERLVAKYQNLFKAEGLAGFRVVCMPSKIIIPAPDQE